MSREYVENRIKDALKASKGNATRARQQIIAWALEDPKLLQALVRPHLTGIVAHAVGRVVHREEEADIADSAAPEEAPDGLDMTPEGFGKEILQVLSSRDTAIFGYESSAPPAGRKPASQRHIDAMRKLAGKKDDDQTG